MLAYPVAPADNPWVVLRSQVERLGSSDHITISPRDLAWDISPTLLRAVAENCRPVGFFEAWRHSFLRAVRREQRRPRQ